MDPATRYTASTVKMRFFYLLQKIVTESVLPKASAVFGLFIYFFAARKRIR